MKMYRPTSTGVGVMFLATPNPYECSGSRQTSAWASEVWRLPLRHRGVDNLALVRHQRPARQFIAQIQLEFPLLDQMEKEIHHRSGVHVAGVEGHGAGNV